jgi:hypothetical protein
MPDRPHLTIRHPADGPPASGAAPDLAARVETRVDPAAPKANAAPIIARLLRRIRDRERATGGGVAGGGGEKRDTQGD